MKEYFTVLNQLHQDNYQVSRYYNNPYTLKNNF